LCGLLRGKSTSTSTKFAAAYWANSGVVNTSLSSLMHHGHQSEPVKSISTSLFSAFACASAFGRSMDQPAFAALSDTAPDADPEDMQPASQPAAQQTTPTVNRFRFVIMFSVIRSSVRLLLRFFQPRNEFLGSIQRRFHGLEQLSPIRLQQN